MDPYANNYVLAIHAKHYPQLPVSQDADRLTGSAPAVTSTPIGLAWLDLSTGQFFTQSVALSMLPSVISRIGPSEIVLEKHLEMYREHALFTTLEDDSHLITFSPPPTAVSIADWSSMLESDVSTAAAATFTGEEIAAGSILLHYVETRLQGLSMKLQPPLRYQAMETMTIDKNTMRALEIKETLRDRLFKGSLIHAIRRTVTKSGARLLTEWLSMFH